MLSQSECIVVCLFAKLADKVADQVRDLRDLGLRFVGHLNHVELGVTGSRITGPGVDVTYSLVEGGGYRLVGLWMKANVDLTVTPTTCRDQYGSSPAHAPGVYGGSVEDPVIRMTGEAVSLDAPRWPQVALAALSAGLGVRTYRR